MLASLLAMKLVHVHHCMMVYTLAFVAEKGGVGKTTLAAGIAVAAAQAGERVVALDLDPQKSLSAWGARRERELAGLTVELVPPSRVTQLKAALTGLGKKGVTLVLLDTAGADSAVTHAAMRVADLCLIPARPSRLDIEATKTTFQAVLRIGRPIGFILNQCAATSRGSRSSEAAAGLEMLGVLAPQVAMRTDHQDALASGLGVTEYAPASKAAAEITELWAWVKRQSQGKL
jgi:chromosome partitioning protein